MKNLITLLQTPRYLAIATALLSAMTLGAAYISQYGFGLKPCILCLYQRIPYALNILLGTIAFLATFRYPRLVMLMLYLSAAIFFIGAAIAGFHVGVEQGWWKGLPSCGGAILPENASLEELRHALTQQEVVRCDKPAWTLFGISMAGYNLLVSLVFGSTLLRLIRRNA